MKKTITIQIKRDNGETETIDVSQKFIGMDDTLFATIKKHTASAGRGECISYTVTEEHTTAEITATEELKSYYRSYNNVISAMNV